MLPAHRKSGAEEALPSSQINLVDPSGAPKTPTRSPESKPFGGRASGPPVVPSVVLVECLTGTQRADAHINRFLKTSEILERGDPRSGSVDTDIDGVSGEGTKVAEVAAQHVPTRLRGGDDESVDGGALLGLRLQ